MTQAIFNLNSQDEEASITRRDILRVLFKHKNVIMMFFLVVTVLVTLGLIYLPPVYIAKGKMLIKTERQGNPTFFSGIASYEERRQSDPVNRTMETEMELVEARPIAEEVVKELNITYHQVYHKPYVHFLLPIEVVVDWVSGFFELPSDPKKQGFDDTVSELVKSIQVAPVKSKSSDTTSNIIEMTIRTHDKDLASKALKGIMKAYQRHNTHINKEAGERAYQIIEKRKNEAYAVVEVNQSEYEVFVAGMQSAQELHNAKLTKHKSVTSPGDVTSIALLKKQIIEKELKLGELKQSYSPNHIPVRQLQKSLDSLKKRIAVETIIYANNDSKLRGLQRKLEASENIYMELEKKLAQIRIYLDMNESQTQSRIIVEPPLAPRKSEWKKDVLMGALGSLAGLIMGIGFAGYREYNDQRIETTKEIQRYFGFEILGTIPELTENELAHDMISLNEDTSSDLIDKFNKIATKLLSRLEVVSPKSQKGKIVYVTSASGNEGKTCAAELLAYCSSYLTNKKVLLVDGNMDIPKVSRDFSIERGAGLSNFLVEGSSCYEAYHKTLFPNLHVLPAGNKRKTGLLFKKNSVEEFTQVIRDSFDIIFIDSSSILSSGSNSFAATADGIVIIVDATLTRRKVLQSAMEDLSMPSDKILGAILNKKRYYIPSFFIQS
jgi:uncharacterized protein involved in exopolysaccharide biosynthesis/Mrp family chromosome partitioning ATPase